MAHSKQKTWLITGADKGLGFQTARSALERGDTVVVTVLAGDGEHELAAAYPDRLRAYHLDARDHARIGPVVAKAEADFGGIDVLVNNAGYGLVALAEATGAEKYRNLFEVNFFGLVEMTRAVLPVMRRQRAGHVINLSSYGGFIGTPGFSFYAASKFAVEGYSESLSREVGHLGIHVTLIEPGGFRSDFAGPSLVQEINTLGEDYAEVASIVADYSARRHGKQPNDPELFGEALCALADAEKPPLRLPLGEDAHGAISADLKAVAEELERWKDLSFSTTRPI
ncbi:oxidoreductase [Celeribacter indicus]|uniref:Oxidoreductase n=1 Tax=Celeribacter indicus TaxID=1208324 RepID=A0A0B5E0A2_9RHOB|nr:oxidoreductase [Celeribacter indicus]AJE49123.1 oxidoreductase [Celeribacter indicus]SDX17025.1 Short-chain dehydrogenase [Celeribacter indicus]